LMPCTFSPFYHSRVACFFFDRDDYFINGTSSSSFVHERAVMPREN
jgi:hypothetical protein